MNGAQIVKKVMEYPVARHYFKGVYSSDVLPHFKPPFSIIANVDDQYSPGSHWLSIMVNNDNIVEFADSFGRRPDNDMFPVSFANYIAKYKLCYYNSVMIEGLFDHDCGEISIYFVILRAMGISFQCIVDSFSVNFDNNNTIVSQL